MRLAVFFRRTGAPPISRFVDQSEAIRATTFGGFKGTAWEGVFPTSEGPTLSGILQKKKNLFCPRSGRYFIWCLTFGDFFFFKSKSVTDWGSVVFP